MLRFEVTEEAKEEDVAKLVASRGTYDGAPFSIKLERTPLQRGGTRPFIEVLLEEDLGATIELRGAHGLHLPTESPVPFASAALADLVLVGAPDAVVRDVASVLDPKLAALHEAGAEVITLEIGPYAERAGVKKRGVRLVARGWPLDEAALDHVLRMILDVRAKIAAAGPKLERHREVIAHERALVFGPGSDAKKQVTKRIAFVGAALLLAALLLAAIASKLGP